MPAEYRQEYKEKSKRNNKFIAKFGAVYTGLAALISDILQPLLDFTLLFLAICGILLVGEIALGFYTMTPKGHWLNIKLRQLTDNFWFKPIFWATTLAFCLLMTMFFLNDDSNNGFLAEHSETVRVLQRELGILNKIEENTRQTAKSAKEIVKYTKESAENTRKMVDRSRDAVEHAKTIAGNTEKLVEQGEKTTKLLTEIVSPADARKKLAQLAIPYTIDGYSSKVMEGDLPILRLFYQAGWDPLTTGSMFMVSPLFQAVAQQSHNYLDVLAQAIEFGNFDPNIRIKYNSHMKYFLMGCELCEWLTGPGNAKLFTLQNTIHDLIQRYTSVNLGTLIAILVPSPSKEVCLFIQTFKLDMETGISFRNSIIECCEKIEKNMPRFKKYLKMNDGKLINTIPSIWTKLSEFRNWYTPEREKFFLKRVNEYRIGTIAITEAVKNYKGLERIVQVRLYKKNALPCLNSVSMTFGYMTPLNKW